MVNRREAQARVGAEALHPGRRQVIPEEVGHHGEGHAGSAAHLDGRSDRAEHGPGARRDHLVDHLVPNQPGEIDHLEDALGGNPAVEGHVSLVDVAHEPQTPFGVALDRLRQVHRARPGADHQHVAVVPAAAAQHAQAAEGREAKQPHREELGQQAAEQVERSHRCGDPEGDGRQGQPGDRSRDDEVAGRREQALKPRRRLGLEAPDAERQGQRGRQPKHQHAPAERRPCRREPRDARHQREHPGAERDVRQQQQRAELAIVFSQHQQPIPARISFGVSPASATGSPVSAPNSSPGVITPAPPRFGSSQRGAAAAAGLESQRVEFRCDCIIRGSTICAGEAKPV